jgi:iron complex outermembrane receptor protein
MLPARRRYRRIPTTPLAFALGVAIAAATPAYAQTADTATTQPATQAEADPAATDLERIEVTGSSIKRIDGETASPLQIISRQQIEDMGAKTLSQVLENVPANMPALVDSRSMFTGTDGASQANLRGLGAQGTLVLLNGRRLSFYGAPSDFQHQFVNIDTIPAAAIERMEVLTDGASAIYGSDAIAGVINVITRRSYKGLEVTLSTEASENVSAYGEHQASAVFGFGDLDADRYNVYGSFNYYKRDAVYPEDDYDKLPDGWYVDNPNYITNFRIHDGSQPGVINPGTLFTFDATGRRRTMAAPGCNNVVTTGDNTSCAANILPYQLAHVPESERYNLFVAGRYLFENGMEGYGEISGTRIDMYSHSNPATFNSGAQSTWFARNTGFNLNSFTYPYLSPTNPYNNLTPELSDMMSGVAGLTYRFLDDPGIFHQRNLDESYRGVAGLRGMLGEWDFDTALSVAGSHSTLYQDTNLSVSGFLEAFGPLSVDPATGRTVISDDPAYQFGTTSEQNRALVQRIFPNNSYHSRTKLITWDGKVEGRIGELAGGEVRSAFGFNVMREEFYSPGNAAAAAGDIVWQGGTWFEGERNIVSLFGEAVLPFTEKLEADVALRADKYPEFDTNLAPKVGIKYQATPELLLRGTYSEGFRAPSLAESGTGGIYAQTVVRDEVRCDQTNAIANLLRQSAVASERERGDELYNSNCSTVAGGITTPNKDLKPETARIGTVGLVFQPLSNLDISVDYFYVNRRNEIIREDVREAYLAAIEQYGPGLIGAPNAFRTDITDADRSVMAEAQVMCSNPANAAACAAGVPAYTVGNLSGMVTDYVNRGRTVVDGFDFDAQARFDLAAAGTLNVGLKTTVMNRVMYDYEDGEGWSENWVGQYDTPRVNAVLNADWQYRKLTTSVFVNYIGGRDWDWAPYEDTYSPENCAEAAGALSPERCAKGIPSFTTTNLNFVWAATDKLRLGLNIQNVFDREPYYDPQGWEGFNHRHNIFGRIYNLTVTYKFW